MGRISIRTRLHLNFQNIFDILRLQLDYNLQILEVALDNNILKLKEQLNNVKHSCMNEKLTFMLIPNAKSNIKKYTFSYKRIIAAGLSVLLITSFISFSSIGNLISSSVLKKENAQLIEASLYQENMIYDLMATNLALETELNLIKEDVASKEELFNQRVENMNYLENQVETLVSMLNKDKGLNIKAPISRSFSRTAPTPPTVATSPNQISEVAEIIDNTEIVDLIKLQADDYSNLIAEIENSLEYLDAKPDFTPTKGRITSRFGMRNDPISNARTMHLGIDIATSLGDPLYAAGNGIVTFSGYNGSYGKIIIISHGYGYKTVYAHNNSNYVKVGQKVEKGDQIGEIGNSGKTTGPHVHFEVHLNGKQINPTKVLK